MNTLKNNQAFTLIEVLASITILGIVLTVFMSFFSNATLFSSKTEDKLTAVNLAEKELYEVTNSLESYCKSHSCQNNNISDQITRSPISLNNKTYLSTVTPLIQNSQEKTLGILPISVRIDSEEHNTLAITYGYVVLIPNN